MLDTTQLITMRDELRIISDRINEMRIDISHQVHHQEPSQHFLGGSLVERFYHARDAVIAAKGLLEVCFHLPAEQPQCSVCRERHPNDNRHPE
jgi:hypothetical protein